MRFISTYFHGITDYLAGIVLVAAPWVLGFAHQGAETWIPVGAGVIMLVASMFTNYELGVVRLIPMPVHLGLDAVMGLLLAASPWLFPFDHVVWIPHLVLGLLEFGAALTTETHPSRSSAHTQYGT